MIIDMSDKYILVKRLPTVEEYKKLRKAVGWGRKEPKAVKIGLNNSLFSICVILNNEVIGCGRIIGDGAIYFYIQDVIVLPEYQRKGIGKRIMNAIMDYFKEHVYTNSFIGLMAAEGVSKFYEKYGFIERSPDMPGMFMRWKQ